MNITTRRYPRDARSAFRDWPESALGIDGPIVNPHLIVRVWRWIFNRWSKA